MLPRTLLRPAIKVYSFFPSSVQRSVKRWYYSDVYADFVAECFDSESEFEECALEFDETDAVAIRSEALSRGTDGETLGDISLEMARGYYALVRKYKPETVIETGVGHGFSTLCLLFALDANENGTLYSIDYPHYSDKSIEEFKQETYENFGGAATIPSDKEPGWIIPDHLRSQWELRIGKSQRELPELAAELDEFDMFVRDSEHSLPCMMMEFEIAWERLTEDGLIVADDVHRNRAFDSFSSLRGARAGLITPTSGYMWRR